MSSIFRLNGSYTTTPQTGNPSGQPSVNAHIDEMDGLVRQAISTIQLTVDTAVSVDLCGLTQVNVLILKTVGGKVRVDLTSADGANQSVPVDSFFVLRTQTVPITAITLTRVAGTLTTVSTFLGERG